MLSSSLNTLADVSQHHLLQSAASTHCLAPFVFTAEVLKAQPARIVPTRLVEKDTSVLAIDSST